MTRGRNWAGGGTDGTPGVSSSPTPRQRAVPEGEQHTEARRASLHVRPSSFLPEPWNPSILLGEQNSPNHLSSISRQALTREGSSALCRFVHTVFCIKYFFSSVIPLSFTCPFTLALTTSFFNTKEQEHTVCNKHLAFVHINNSKNYIYFILFCFATAYYHTTFPNKS